MSTLTLPLAALGALVAALIETSIAPELPIAGAQVDLVLAFAVVAAVLIGFEDGLVWAFLGGLMLDMLIPDRPIGATALAMLIVVGLALVAARLPGPRRTLAIAAVFVTTWAFHLLLLLIMAMTEGVMLGSLQPLVVLSAAIQNTAVAVVAAVAFDVIGRRFGPAERLDW
jgi:rod shape-determining protein MreD